jgi:hypothetical protein
MRELIAIATRNIALINAPQQGWGENGDITVPQLETQGLSS